MSPSFRTIVRLCRNATVALLALSFIPAGGCASHEPYDGQRTFTSADRAVTALISAAALADTAEIEAIFGEHAREVLSSGDPVVDRMNREIFAVAAAEHWRLEPLDGSAREIVIGHEEWPFPVPLVRDRRGWWFDTAAGADEIRARAIGRNELATIGALYAYVVAQLEYASESRGSTPAGVFAQRIRSTPGTRDGLYWPRTSPDEPASPLAAFVADATAEGYTLSDGGPRPFHGYMFRILTRQGPAAPGGARDYVRSGVTSGLMTEGFAMIAVPAKYGYSGIMTFIVGPDGVVYETDLGTETTTLAAAIDTFNPDADWSIVE